MLSIYLFAFMICGVLSENINCQFKPGCDNRQEIRDLKQDVRNLVQKVADLEEKNEKAEKEIKKLQKKVDLMEDLLWFDGKRYIALASEKVNKATAESKCQNLGGNLANLYNSAHMNRIINYVRQYKLDGSSYKSFHLGMIYDPINKILCLRDRTQVSVSDYKWFPGDPANGARYTSYTNMFIKINSDPSYAYQYLYNWSDYNRYVLCEI